MGFPYYSSVASKPVVLGPWNREGFVMRMPRAGSKTNKHRSPAGTMVPYACRATGVIIHKNKNKTRPRAGVRAFIRQQQQGTLTLTRGLASHSNKQGKAPAAHEVRLKPPTIAMAGEARARPRGCILKSLLWKELASGPQALLSLFCFLLQYSIKY